MQKTIDVAKYISSVSSSDNIESVVIHVRTNNLINDSNVVILNNLEDLIKVTSDKFQNAKIFLSTLIHRESNHGQRSLNQNINRINSSLERLANEQKVKLICNVHLTGERCRYDGLHLSNTDASILVKNIKTALRPNNRSLPSDKPAHTQLRVAEDQRPTRPAESQNESSAYNNNLPDQHLMPKNMGYQENFMPTPQYYKIKLDGFLIRVSLCSCLLSAK